MKVVKLKRSRILDEIITIVINTKVRIISKEIGVPMNTLYKYFTGEVACPDHICELLQNYTDDPIRFESEDEANRFFDAAYKAVIRKRKIDEK